MVYLAFFTIDFRAFIFLLVAAFLFYIWRLVRGKIDAPALYYSRLESLQHAGPSLKSWAADFPNLLKKAALGCLVLAFLDPQIVATPKQESLTTHKVDPKEGLAIYFLLDQSGSMAMQVVLEDAQGLDVQFVSKAELLKRFTKKFLADRPQDMIGIVQFARVPQIMSPLTLDHDSLQSRLDSFNVIQNKEYDGTGIGYAIYKTAHIIASTRYFAQELEKQGKPAYDIKGAIMIVVTDGFQSPNPEDKDSRLRTIGLQEAAEYAKSQGIKLYVINIDPLIKNEEFAPQRHLMERVSELTGGKFFTVDNPSDLSKVYATIDKLEKTQLPQESAVQSLPPERLVSFYPYLIGLGLLGLFAGLLLESTFLRSIP